MSYIFQREDNGEFIEVDFATMMTQDSAGRIRLDAHVKSASDGTSPVYARRCVRLEMERNGESNKSTVELGLDKPIVSDSLGFCSHQFAEMELDRERNGFRGVEFVPDPRCEHFFQVKCSSPRVWRRYLKHRGMSENNRKNGSAAALGPALMNRAERAIREKFGANTQKEHAAPVDDTKKTTHHHPQC